MSMHKSLTFGIPTNSDPESFSTTPLSVFTFVSSVFTDVTTAANDATVSDVTIPFAAGDMLYIRTTLNTNYIFVETTTAGSSTRIPEYWNGSSWVTLNITFSSGNSDLTGDSIGYFVPPSNWAITSVNTVSGYWIRWRCTSGTSATIASHISTGQFVENTIAIQLPETNNRVIRNAWVSMYCYTDSTALWSVRGPLLQYKIDSSDWYNIALDQFALTQSGEHIPLKFMFDISTVASLFLSGASHNISIRFSLVSHVAGGSITTWAMPGGMIGITYTADPQDIRIKTVVTYLWNFGVGRGRIA